MDSSLNEVNGFDTLAAASFATAFAGMEACGIAISAGVSDDGFFGNGLEGVATDGGENLAVPDALVVLLLLPLGIAVTAVWGAEGFHFASGVFEPEGMLEVS
jgi:hypothetical protein